MSEKGYIKLHRKIRDHKYWPKKRKYSEFEAWMDLLLSAAGLPHEIKHKGQVYKLKRGELVISLRKLGERWGWTKDMARHLIRRMRHDGEISTRSMRQQFSIVTIMKYNAYNPLPDAKRDASRHADEESRHASRHAKRDNINKDNINKNKNKDVNKKSKTYMSSQFKNDIIFKWNKLAQEYNLAALIDINSGSVREKNLRARSAEKNFDFDLLIDMIRNSPFLLGKTKDPFFVFFDWIIKPTNYQKIIEGNYLDRRSYSKFSGIIEAAQYIHEKSKKGDKNENGRS